MLKHGEPVRYVYRTATKEDLAVRVVRSMSASIEVPELGVRIDPGPTCQGFVSNIEGVLNRIVKAVESAVVDGDYEERKNARGLLERIASVKCGELPVTIILEDPTGNSAIVSDTAEKSTYTVEPEPYG
jgi:zinc finger protein